jgi:serine-type D-Ala-D-Ala carboxypeptidase/endopeptidase
MKRLAILALTLSALSPFALTHPERSVSAGGIDGEIQHALASQPVAERGPGIVVGIITPEGRQVLARGRTSADGAPVTGGTLFEIASLTKVFTTSLLSDMVRRGEVALSDPIGKYLPAGMTLPERGGRAITLHDLATHTSGLPRLPTNFAPRDPANPYVDYTVERLYEFLSTYQLTRVPGERYEYSNLGMGLLGHVLARRAATDYETLVVKRIAAPLAMDATRMLLSPALKARLATGHDETLKAVPYWEDTTLAGAGSLFSSVDDLLTFLSASFEEETPLADATAAALMDRRQTGFADLTIGLGWHVSRRAGRDLVWHNGGTAGFASYMATCRRRVSASSCWQIPAPASMTSRWR